MLGARSDGRLRLTAAGAIARDEWLRTGDLRPDVVLDVFAVLPDHVHLVFGLIGRDDIGACDDGHVTDHRSTAGTARCAPTQTVGVMPPPGGTAVRRFRTMAPDTVPSIVRAYKSAVTRRVRAETPHVGPVWQRGFYDRVVRTDREAEAVRRYVIENPAR